MLWEDQVREGTEKGLKEEEDRPRRLARRIREVKGWRKGTLETQFVYKCRSHYFRVEAERLIEYRSMQLSIQTLILYLFRILMAIGPYHSIFHV